MLKLLSQLPTGKWDQGELLITKARVQMAQGQLMMAVKTYGQLLAILQVQNKSFGCVKKSSKGDRNRTRSLELEVWHDLASLYISLSQWHDAEVCLSESKAINSYSASRYHITGMLNEKKGLQKAALEAFSSALDIDPAHVPSMVSTAAVLQKLGVQPKELIRGFLMEALLLDRTNSSTWYNLGLIYKSESRASSLEDATECFGAATFLEETAPVEPFR